MTRGQKKKKKNPTKQKPANSMCWSDTLIPAVVAKPRSQESSAAQQDLGHSVKRGRETDEKEEGEKKTDDDVGHA